MFVENFCLLSVCGDSVAAVCEDGLLCCVDITVFVASVFEFEKHGRVTVEGDSVQCLFPLVYLFMFDIVIYFFVYCLHLIKSIMRE